MKLNFNPIASNTMNAVREKGSSFLGSSYAKIAGVATLALGLLTLLYATSPKKPVKAADSSGFGGFKEFLSIMFLFAYIFSPFRK